MTAEGGGKPPSKNERSPQMKLYLTVIASLLLLDGILFYAFYGAWTEEYNAEPSETEKQAVAYYSAQSAKNKQNEKENNEVNITDEFLMEVMASEKPSVVPNNVSKTEPRYKLTSDERNEIEQVVMAEAGTECREGIMAVAQCVLNASEKEGIRPTEAVLEYKYTPDREEPNEAVKEAVRAVFDNGETVTDEPILYFYATYIDSEWHETKRFVMQIGVHRFFAEKELETK